MIFKAPHEAVTFLPALGTVAIESEILASIVLLSIAILALQAWKLTERKRRNRELVKKVELLNKSRKYILDFLHDLGEAFTEGINLDELLYMIANFSVTTTQAAAGAVFLFDKEKQYLQAEVVIGPFPPALPIPETVKAQSPASETSLEQLVKSQRVRLREGIIGEVARSGKPVLIQDGLRDPRLVQHEIPELQTRTAIFIPLKFKDEVLGVMAVVNKEKAEAADYFNANDLFLLDSLADHAAISLYNATLYTLEAQQKQLDSDLRVASEIQKMLLPGHAPSVKNFQIEGYNLPARHVGGDYYDFLPLNDSRVGIVIADVSGKAIPSALVMTICRSAIRAQARLSESPTEVLQHVHESVIPDLREDMFVTILYGILDTNNRTFTFVRAGHDPVLWYHANTGVMDVIAPKGMAVGMDRIHRLDERLEECKLPLLPGDIITLYTDGITEALNGEDEEFGRDRLINTIKNVAHENADKILQSIFERLRQFTADIPPHDDRTLIVIKAG
ncbi:PP2C family protein-serine/threonine phosphatase [Pedosphaera parvula]|uniref:Protein serine phosphatase with GAF(S) sensor(S) n=1 Tax=Pedosphaera parvula (strain Ellin514) TaxID=320771 RepID=B9XNK4_PEDPL|nr:GAF domain-containing SpoIIE family protein phosphatase [Pedosphaera parvula]EEF58544.1 protein serine phosphatase with GAF(s) sensor(s) [Pedosphaera parvula Ellin514]